MSSSMRLLFHSSTGADSLTQDRLGCFNLSLQGHAEAVKFIKSFRIPLLVTGGGGYTKANVARCWTYETGVLVEKQLEEDLPHNAFYEYFEPEHKINILPSKDLINHNTRAVSWSHAIQNWLTNLPLPAMLYLI